MAWPMTFPAQTSNGRDGEMGSVYENPPHILGAQLTERYPQILRTEGLLLVGEQSDEGDHPYYLISKP
jgi:hypothetical protein